MAGKGHIVKIKKKLANEETQFRRNALAQMYLGIKLQGALRLSTIVLNG